MMETLITRVAVKMHEQDIEAGKTARAFFAEADPAVQFIYRKRAERFIELVEMIAKELP